MFTRTFLVGSLGLVALAACGDSTTGPNDSTRYFPMDVGNRWTYAPENPFFGDPFQWQVTERLEDTVTLVRPVGGSHPGPVQLLDRLDVIDLILEDEENARFYQFAAGSSWVHRDPWECDDGPTFAVAWESEPVVTPAGTFTDCLRIERRTPATCTDAGTTVEWWAPEVGLVQWEELNFYAGGPLRFHLIDFDVG